MDYKRILRAPLFWVVAVIAVTLMVFSLSDAGGYTRIDTSAAQQLIVELRGLCGEKRDDEKGEHAQLTTHLASGFPRACLTSHGHHAKAVRHEPHSRRR